jgi:hypothetical protein
MRFLVVVSYVRPIRKGRKSRYDQSLFVCDPPGTNNQHFRAGSHHSCSRCGVPFTPPFGKWTRLSPDPIESPHGDNFESAGTFNPSVVKKDGKFVMLYRAQDHGGTSSLGYATSDDGIHFTRRPEPVMVSETPYEKGGGVEDPRLQKIGNTYYLTYTGYNNVDGAAADKKDAQLCLAACGASLGT